MKRKEAQVKYKWDFSYLYKNYSEWKEDLANANKICDQIINLKGSLNKKQNFINYLKLEQENDLILTKLNQYAHLIDIDQTNNENQELSSMLEDFYQLSNIKVSFLLNELKDVGEEAIFDWLKESGNEAFNYYFEVFFKSSKFILSKTDEELMSRVARSRGVVGNLYDSLAYADRQNSKIIWNEKEVELNSSLYREIMENSKPLKDQEKRKEAQDLYFENFSSRRHSFAKIYEAIIQEQNENKNIRGYKSILEMNLFNDQVSEEIYLKLIEFGKETISFFKKYNNLINKTYKFDKFYSTDRLLKITKDYNRTFEVEQGIKVVRESLNVLGKEYISKLNIAFKDNLIDYFEDENKSDGAYSSGGNGVEPIILMNWDYKLGSVNTLAHEIGHSVHTLFSDETQKYPLNNYPIILAEVASTFNEHILFDYLYSNSKYFEERKYLVQQRLFDLISTFYRQIQFADFEYCAHKLIEEEKPITTEVLNNLYKQKENEFGYDDFDDKDDSKYSWPYISHFFQSPFYVYKYAIDLVASFKLYNDFKNGDKKNIIDFLKKGGSKKPLEILKEVGVDFMDRTTYLPLVEEIDRLIIELENRIK